MSRVSLSLVLKTGRSTLTSSCVVQAPAVKGLRIRKAPLAEPVPPTPERGFHLKWRAMIELTGRDSVDLLQGLLTSDVTKLNDTTTLAQYSMMLNVQGRVLYDLILYNNSTAMESSILVECDYYIKDEVIEIIQRYKMRKKVDIHDATRKYQIWCIPSNTDPKQPQTTPPVEDPEEVRLKIPHFTIFYVMDPRVPWFGHRAIFKYTDEPFMFFKDYGEEQYQAQRYRWGIPEGPVELPPGKCLPLESNLSFMKGVSFSKGCYIGQELTARTQHTGVIRKRIVPLVCNGIIPPLLQDSELMTQKKKRAGKLLGASGIYALALLRLEHLGDALTIRAATGQDVVLLSYEPGWWPGDPPIL